MDHCCILGPLGRQRTRCSKRRTDSTRTRPAGVSGLSCTKVHAHHKPSGRGGLTLHKSIQVDGSTRIMQSYAKLKRTSDCVKGANIARPRSDARTFDHGSSSHEISRSCSVFFPPKQAHSFLHYNIQKLSHIQIIICPSCVL